MFETYHFSLWFDEGPVGAVHLVVEAAGVAEVVPVAVPPPQRGGGGRAVDALATLCRGEEKIRESVRPLRSARGQAPARIVIYVVAEVKLRIIFHPSVLCLSKTLWGGERREGII